jgi:hypothetical protein
MKLRALAALSVAAALGLGSAVASANVPVLQISHDTFTNATSQHATEVEPDTFAFGSTIVSTFQVGRFFDGGGSDIGFATSTDGGSSWTSGFLSGLTFNATPNVPYERVSDASVAYDAAHNVWMISSIPILANGLVPTVTVNRSTDGGLNWGAPATIPPPVARTVNLDKNWTVCDSHVLSPFYGHCYTEFDNFGDGDRELMSTSTDGGQTWGTPVETAGHDKGLGGQPVVQPSGRVIVPFESLNGTISAFSSSDGGASWSRGVKVANIRFHGVAGGLRTSPLPSAEVAGDGRVFVAWEDCRFRAKCASNDIVFSTSGDGASWTDPARVPIDAPTSTVDHFIPGLAVDPVTSGASTHLALTYYFYPTANCGTACQLSVGYISSPDAGAHWGNPVQLAGPMALSDIAQTSQGPMVGDYISTSFVGASARVVFPVGLTHGTGAFDEAMYTPTAALAVATPAEATNVASSAGVVGPVTGVGTGETHHDLKQE